MDTSGPGRLSNTFGVGISRRAALGRLAAGGVAAASLLAIAGRGHAQAQATPGPSDEEGGEANHFVLAGGEVQITFDTTGFAGEPQLTYRGPIGAGPLAERPIDSRTVVGDEIRTTVEPEIRKEGSALVRLVTVYLDAWPDAAVFYLTLVLPECNSMIADAPIPFAGLAILTTVRTTIAGDPAPNEGEAMSARSWHWRARPSSSRRSSSSDRRGRDEPKRPRPSPATQPHLSSEQPPWPTNGQEQPSWTPTDPVTDRPPSAQGSRGPRRTAASPAPDSRPPWMPP